MTKLKSILEQSCPNGYVWCMNTKKCIPVENQRSKGQGKNKGFGRGRGPVGVPKREQKIDQLVDEIFDGGFDKLGGILTIEKQVDEMMDKFEDKADPVNVNISSTITGGVDVKITESDILDMLENLRENDGYKEYFKNKLKDAGYNSPKDIPDDKKKEFFRSVDYGWKAQDETEEIASLGGAALATRKAVIGR